MNYAPPSLLDPAFKYTNSAETDIRKTFERIRRMQNNDADGATRKDVPLGTVETPLTSKPLSASPETLDEAWERIGKEIESRRSPFARKVEK